ncbi:hypothetical protein GGU11DRAFT_814755 [Lentinula aff. detonsa]|uniref:RlpA-like protein double-psi beta-barrel domain-containing protein n=1 Tax=Lentinula aff. detonsa TaxID=2804958 RepID=A0AA38KT72_9AGAR|nr:hypothetical protein GGU10DRAFT_88875 [Lentinula aff. detonsa]KAJ3800438.1 hypothetical protein GGU11DRAFT_814755 [Lentinula aff. detonsa]
MSRPVAALMISLFLVSFTFSLPGVTSSVLHRSSSSSSSSRNYRRAHSLGSSYDFDPRDGWTTFNATNLPQNSSSTLESRSNKAKTNSGKAKVGVSDVTDVALKALSKFIGVNITWYTGHDLLNPSCWANSKWTPTDESFVCALTLDGWETKPKCFDFLELCNGPQKCVYARVVDSCAGCAAGSKHVDLTKAAFGQLASLDVGILPIQMRIIDKPGKSEWNEDIWGPPI